MYVFSKCVRVSAGVGDAYGFAKEDAAPQRRSGTFISVKRQIFSLMGINFE